MHQNIQSFDQNLEEKIMYRLRNAEEYQYPEILRWAAAPTEVMTARRFLSVLKLVKKYEHKGKCYAVAQAMVGGLSVEANAFVLSVLENNVLGRGRLNAAVRLQYFCMSPFIILDHLFTDQRVDENVQVAVANFTMEEISNVIEFTVQNSRRPELLVERMRHEICFSTNYFVNWDTIEKWKESVVRSFVELVCDQAGIPLPESARPMILRTELDLVVKAFFGGTIEPQEVYRIVSRLTKNTDEYRLAIHYTGERSNAIAQTLAQMGQLAFERKLGASDFTPECAMPFNSALHELVSDKTIMIVNKASTAAFGKAIAGDPQLAIQVHRGAMIPERGEMLLFRLRRQCFLYNRQFSRSQKSEMAVILQREARGKRIFVFQREMVVRFVEEEFEWTPTDPVESEEIARQRGIAPNIPGFVRYLTNGEYCRRGRNFVNFSFPSPVVQRHLDIQISAVYAFCLGLNGLVRDRLNEQSGAESRGE